jgi:Flp pilus assembly protein TadG
MPFAGGTAREPALPARTLPLASSGHPAKRRGATAVEFALVSPIVLLIFFGLVEVARGLMVAHLLSNAARLGARAGVIEGQSTANIQSVVTAALAAQGISSDTVTVQVNDGSTDASAANPGDEITVLVTVPVSKVTWIPTGSFLGGNLSGQYTLRRE